jgi:hypothetical protein
MLALANSKEGRVNGLNHGARPLPHFLRVLHFLHIPHLPTESLWPLRRGSVPRVRHIPATLNIGYGASVRSAGFG